MKRRSWIPSLAVVLAFGAAFELAARVEDWVRYDMPFDSPYRSEGDLVVRDSLGMHGRPHAAYLKWRMNSLGLRGPEITRHRPDGVLRVVVAGASEAFGQSESPGQEFPRQLEDSLRALLRASGPDDWQRVEVLNAAFFGMSLPTVIQDVELRVRDFEPQVIVLYPTTAQYLADEVPAAAGRVPGQSGDLNRWHAARPRAIERLREQLKRVTPRVLREWRWRAEFRAAADNRPEGWRFTSVPAQRVEAFDHDLRRFVGAVRAIGAVPVLSTHANRYVGGGTRDSALLAAWQRFYPRADGEVILAFDSVGAHVTGRVAADSGIAVADIRAALSGCEACFADYAHLTDQGAARAARAAAAAVMQVVESGRIGTPSGRSVAGR
jgi:hypothetical protein